MIIEIKRCPKCAQTKSTRLFSRDRSKPAGFSCWCKECLNESSRRYHAANREKRVAYIRARRMANPPSEESRAAAVERTRQWCEQNPEKHRTSRKNRKYNRRAREGGGMTAAELRQWEAAQKKVCHWCGVRCDDHEIDHRVPLAKGGKHERRNLVISCRPCNRRKGARDPVEFAQSMGKLV